VGALVSLFFAPKSGEGTRKYLSKKLNEGTKHARRKARELRERADDLVERGKEMVSETKEQIAADLDEVVTPNPLQKSKAESA
jgi:gas vesicle protein